MAEFRHLKRTHSDPDMPSLVPLAQRPHSSYHQRHEKKDFAQFQPAVIEAMSKVIGIDIETQQDFHWVVRDCLLALKEDNWTVELQNGDLVYVHSLTEEARSFHSIVDMHRQLAARLQLQAKEFHQKRLDPHYRIKELVFKAIMGETDVRRVCTPQLISEIMLILNVDVLNEPFLIKRVKTAIEDAYFRMVDNPGRVASVDSIFDVKKLLVMLELDRVNFLKKVSPSKLVYCVECEAALGDVACADCHDILCNSCCVALHSTGHRQDHQQVFIEQCVCSECEQQAAVVRCQDCADLFCYDCFKATHKAGKRARHCVRLPFVTYCFECDEREASYICMECEDVMCSKCCSHLHRKGARQNHTLFGIRRAAYPKKLFADNLDRVMQILSRNVDQTLNLSPWLLFYDDALNPFWFNFQTREHIRVSKDSSFLKSPDHEESVDVLQSEAALAAQKTSVFHVPPPVHIKFATPSAMASGGAPMYRDTVGLRDEIQSLATAQV